MRTLLDGAKYQVSVNSPAVFVAYVHLREQNVACSNTAGRAKPCSASQRQRQCVHGYTLIRDMLVFKKKKSQYTNDTLEKVTRAASNDGHDGTHQRKK